MTCHDLFSYLSEILSRQKFWPSFMTIGLKMWPLECTQVFSKIRSSDLVFDPTQLIFTLIPDFIKANILTKFHGYWMENVASRAYTCFSKIWPSDLVFDLIWPIFVLKFHPDKHSIMFHAYQTENLTFRAYTRQKVDDRQKTPDTALSQ